jgi:acetyl esterase
MRLPASLQLLLSRKRQVRLDRQALDPTLQMLLAIRPAHAGLVDVSPVESRARLRREVIAARGPLTPVGAVRNLRIDGAEGALPARHYAPVAADTRSLLVYFHGGGFVIGDLDTHDELCRLLCHAAGTSVLSVEYRLAPEHPFPAPVEDAVAAFRWAVQHAGELGAEAANVSVGGDSAGGTLAAVVALLTKGDRARPAAQLLIYPATDRNTPRPSHQLFDQGFMLTRNDRDGFYHYYLEGTGADANQPRISPLRAESLGGLPPALVVTAGFDILRDEGEAYAAALTATGTRCQVQRETSLAHGFVNLTGVCPAAHRAVLDMARRWRSLMGAA